MGKHHHHHSCPREQEEIFDRIYRRCCGDRRPEGLLPAELSPGEVRRLRCILDCLTRCLCRPFSDFEGVAGLEDILERQRDRDRDRDRY